MPGTVVGVIVDVVLMERDKVSQSRAGGDQSPHRVIASLVGGGRQMRGQRIVITAALPVMNDRDAVVDPEAGEDLEVPGDVGVSSAPDVEHDQVGECSEEWRRRVRDIRQDLVDVPCGREGNPLAQRVGREGFQ